MAAQAEPTAVPKVAPVSVRPFDLGAAGSAGIGSLTPPPDDPAAVAEYLELLDEFRSSNANANMVAPAAAGPCLSSAVVKGVSQGTTVAVYRSTSAPRTVCVNAAQAVYDNEYKPLVSSTYEGQKWRDQLVCHIANAWDKRPWNLDSWRPNVGYPATVAAQCNP
ncbi:DUF2599 domain-containing protein [Agromyces italicus]|uniref:DUF2599 domain-containing protein n=1 Tax=Agromyces italicus TaxID=279572 RepID=UPI00146D5C7A|nr:DUF2599 domain-containing protein [Agromyces italicus]